MYGSQHTHFFFALYSTFVPISINKTAEKEKSTLDMTQALSPVLFNIYM